MLIQHGPDLRKASVVQLHDSKLSTLLCDTTEFVHSLA